MTGTNSDTKDTMANGPIKLEAVKGIKETDSLCHGDGKSIESGSGSGASGTRAEWGGKMEFIMTCIGYAVGLGNVWRFPYLCYKNGGGAFLVPYVLMLAFLGLPFYYMELAFGQFASLGPITVWKINRTMKGLGYAMVSVSWLIAVYYNVVIAHVMVYLFASFAAIPTSLPWVTCDNWWNSPDCIQPVYNTSQVGANSTGTDDAHTAAAAFNNSVATTASPIAYLINGTGKPKTPSEEYYMNFVLEQSSGMESLGPVNWKLALCLFLAWGIILICLIRGIQSLGKVVYFTAIFPYVMLTILLVRSVTLPGAVNGIIYYLKPDFSRLIDPRVWSDAATQIFYSLAACSGGLIAMASYNKFDNNCYRDSILVVLINCGTSIYSGFVIFCVLGFMALEKGVDVADVAAGGPGLAFVVYPEALSRMPAPQLWAIFFFFMMATLGFGSQLSIVECVLSAFTDEFAHVLRGKYPSMIFRSLAIFFTFLMGLPMCTKGGIYLLNLVDYSVSGFPLLVVGFIELVVMHWVYGFNRFASDLSMMLGHRPGIYWRLCWQFLSPLIILLTTIMNMIYYKPPSMDGYYYNSAAQALGWCISLFPISLIFGFFAWTYCRNGGFSVLRELVEPKPEWGPALEQNRTGRYEDTEAADRDHRGVQCDFSTMWTQTRIVLARTPMPSMINLANSIGGTASTMNLATTPQDLLSTLVEESTRECGAAASSTVGTAGAAEVEVVDASAGGEDDALLSRSVTAGPASTPITIPGSSGDRSGVSDNPVATFSIGDASAPPLMLEVRLTDMPGIDMATDTGDDTTA